MSRPASDDTVCWHPAGCFAPVVAHYHRGRFELAACAKHEAAVADDPSMKRGRA